MQVINDKPFTLTAPFGQLPLLLDKDRRSDPAHVCDVALEILRRAGAMIDDAYELKLRVWQALLDEQYAYALDHNPFLRGSTEYLTPWQHVVHGLLGNEVELILNDRVRFAEVALTA